MPDDPARPPSELVTLLTQLEAEEPSTSAAFAERPLDDVSVHDFAFHEFLLDFTRGFGGQAKLSEAAAGYLARASAAGLDGSTISQLREMLTAIEEAFTRALLYSPPVARDDDTEEPSLGERLQKSLPALYSSPAAIAWLLMVGATSSDFSGMAAALMTELSGARGRVVRIPESPETWVAYLRSDFTMWDDAGTRTEFSPEHLDAASFEALLGVIERKLNPPKPKQQAGVFIDIAEVPPPIALSAFPPPSLRHDWQSYLLWWFEWQIATRRTTSTSDTHDYDFDPALPLAANVGLRLTYRQTWRPLAMQVGELVRTIPLGPGQKERVSTKTVRRTKTILTREQKGETERSSDSSNTTKNSSDVVSETASALNWDVKARVTGGIEGIGSAELSGGAGGNSESKSKATSSFLSEAVSKTAVKMRQETKVTVSTEAESSFEQERASEIVNPNNEIATTYEYYQLQQQYEVFTGLAVVEGVIFVAETVPQPWQINSKWVRRHDWILGQALKDESYRATLNEVSAEVDAEIDPVAGDPYGEMLSKAREQFAQFTSNPATSPQAGLSIPDIYAAPQHYFRERTREVSERIRGNETRRLKRERLFNHIRQYILHYCRAIWTLEDREQRHLRYAKENRQIPVEWLADLQITPTGDLATGPWRPSGKTVPLVDVIDPTGPLGFAGNYSVWLLKPTSQPPRVLVAGKFDAVANALTVAGRFDTPRGKMVADLRGILALLKAEYVDAQTGDLLDPALAGFRAEASVTPAERLATLTDEVVYDLVSYLPEVRGQFLDANPPATVIRDANGKLGQPPTTEQWAQYLYRRNGTRRFLLDNENLHLRMRVGQGTVLEPFKRAHRYIDVLRAAEDLKTSRLRNERRAKLKDQVGAYDPDISKVVVVGSGMTPDGAAGVAVAPDPAVTDLPPSD